MITLIYVLLQSLSVYCPHAGVLELLPQAVLEEGQRELSGLLVGLTGKVGVCGCVVNPKIESGYSESDLHSTLTPLFKLFSPLDNF